MIKAIKKVLANRQVKQAHKRRLKDNQRQLNLIYNSLIERGY